MKIKDLKNVENLFIEAPGTDGNGVVTLNTQNRDAMSEVLKAVDWDSAEDRKAIADTVTKKLQEEIRQEDISQFFASRDTFGVNETPEYQFQKGLKAYVHEPGSFAARSEIIQRTITLDTELVTVHPSFELSQLKGGRFGSLANIKSMAKEELVGHRNAVLWNVLRNSVTATAALGTNSLSWAAAGSVLVKKQLLVSGLDYVDDISPTGVQAIVGRRSVLGFIMEIDGYSDKFQEIRDSGGNIAGGIMMGTFRSVPIVALHQYTDGLDVNRIAATDIMIVARDTTKLAITEELSNMEWINEEYRQWHLRLDEKYGAAVFWPSRNVRIAIS